MSMKRFISLGITLSLIMVLWASVPISSETTYTSDTDELNCYILQNSVTVDGAIGSREWADAESMQWWFEPESEHKDAYIYVYAKWDGSNYLYLMVDLCPDNSTEEEDYCGWYLDEDHNSMFGYGTAKYEHYGTVYGDDTTSLWSFHDPPETGAEDYDDLPFAIGYGKTDKVAWNHRIIEFKIALSFINQTSTMGLLILGYGTLSPTYFSTEGANSTNYESNETCLNWTDLKLRDYTKPVQYYSPELASDIMTVVMFIFLVALLMTILFYIKTR